MNRCKLFRFPFVSLDKYKRVCIKARKYRERVYSLIEEKKDICSRILLLDETNANLQERIISIEKQLSENEKKYNDLLVSSSNKDTIVKEEQQSDTSEFYNCTRLYRPLYETMLGSDIFKELMVNFGIKIDLSNDEIENMVCFVRMIGNGLSFADILYIYLEQKCVVLGVPEKVFMLELNQFYRNLYGIQYDVVLFFDVNLDNHFNKLLMKDNIRRNEIFKYYSELYVPAIMRDMKNVEKRAIVKGYN